jgi:hypothetical protein
MMVPFTDKAPTGPSPCDGARWYTQQEFIKQLIHDNPTIKTVVMDGIDRVVTNQVIDRVQEWVDFLESTGAHVVIFEPHIVPEGDIRGCFSRPFRAPQKSCAIDPTRISDAADAFAPLVSALNLSNPKVSFFDQNQVFCSDGQCSFVKDGKPMIRDEYGHYSEYASRLVANLFAIWENSGEHSKAFHR